MLMHIGDKRQELTAPRLPQQRDRAQRLFTEDNIKADLSAIGE